MQALSLRCKQRTGSGFVKVEDSVLERELRLFFCFFFSPLLEGGMEAVAERWRLFMDSAGATSAGQAVGGVHQPLSLGSDFWERALQELSPLQQMSLVRRHRCVRGYA